MRNSAIYKLRATQISASIVANEILDLWLGALKCLFMGEMQAANLCGNVSSKPLLA
jgi:hypothetical protein